jgi:uncharacterized protein (DUF2235 family)
LSNLPGAGRAEIVTKFQGSVLHSPTVGKKIVLFSDGTGNSAAKLSKTNVWRLYQMLDLSDPTDQIAYYDDGVGTSSFKPLAIIGGAFGYGLKRNVLDLYCFLCSNYEPGDAVYCYGFSRGAFTARVLAGFIAHEGIIRPDSRVSLRALAAAGFRRYRERYSSAFRLEVPGRIIRDLLLKLIPGTVKDYDERRKENHKPRISHLGLWDMVAAYGLPMDELTRAAGWIYPLSLPSRKPMPEVDKISHAVSLDDERNTFHPVLFDESTIPQDASSTLDESLSQVWFCGMHSNVGGGYPDDALSHVPLVWMVDEARRAGLRMKPKEEAEARDYANAVGRMYDSRRGVGGFYRYLPRKMAMLTHDDFHEVTIDRPKIHESVAQRLFQGVDSYAPIGFPERYAVVRPNGDIVPSMIEVPAQALSRVQGQEHTWNLVWWKRIAYFLSVGVTAALLLFPRYNPAGPTCEGWTCFVSPVIGLLQAVLPDFASPWLAAYQTHPDWFLGLAALLIVLLQWGDKVQGRIGASMRQRWVSVMQGGSGGKLPSGGVYAIRTNALYQWSFRQLKRWILPAFFGSAALWIILTGVGHVLFNMAGSAGLVCSGAGDGGHVFSTSDLCWATGETVTRGERYRITITEKDQWFDGDKIKAGLDGFGVGPGKMPRYVDLLAQLLKRKLDQPWFRPVARIGQYGTDEYPLVRVDPAAAEFTAEITARRTGMLYLFVNDAALPVPDSWQALYLNNHGTAQVSVVRTGGAAAANRPVE